MSDIYFITGGSGFIGRQLVKRLLVADEQVRLVGRNSSDFSEFENSSQVTIFRGSLNDKSFINEAMKGVDFVLHLAGYAKNWSKDKSLYRKINIDASLVIAEAAHKNKVKKMVHVSTIVALGPTDNTIQNEEYSPENQTLFTEYEKSKKEAEEKVLGLAQKGLNVVAINPTRVYGPGLLSEANSLTLMIKNYLKFKNYLILGSGKSIANYVFVEDVVSGILLSAKKGKRGNRYIIGGENSTLKGFFAKIREVSGKRAFAIRVPRLLALAIAVNEEILAKIFGKYPLITRPWVDHFLAHWVYSSAKAKKELGYKPMTLDTGLKHTINWLRKTD